jgi:hypothetical protein
MKWTLAITGLCVAALALVGPTGCAAPQQPVTIQNPVEIETLEYARMFDATVLVLRDEGFHIDREDYRFGTITTRPAPASTLLEPWKSDNTTDDQSAQSTINQQRRQITITFEPRAPDDGEPNERAPQWGDESDDSPGYLMRAEVLVERLVVPITYLTGSTDGRRVLDKLSSVPAEWQRRGMVAAYWRPLGRDPHLEQRLLVQIVRRSFDVTEPIDSSGSDDAQETEPPPAP